MSEYPRRQRDRRSQDTRTYIIPHCFDKPETEPRGRLRGTAQGAAAALLNGADHIEPVTGVREVAPFIAWLRLWVFGDEGAKPFFYGSDCKLCKAPWTMPAEQDVAVRL